MGEQDIAAPGRARDLERYHRRTAERVAQGLCQKCGKRPPAPDHQLCEPCNEKTNRASRARDARLRAAGMPRRDRERAREYERERSRRETEARRAAGICTKCGQSPAVEGRASCEPCLEKRRASDRAKYAAGKAAGLMYGGANPVAKRKSARLMSKRRQKARREAGLCIRCGKQPPVEGGTTCAPCRDKRQAAERQQYGERRAAGLCTRCGGPVLDGQSRCGPCAVIEEASKCPERKNARSRKLYAERRARGLCTSCGAPSQDHVSYYTSTVPIVARLVCRLSPREPLPRLFRRRGVGDFEQAVTGVAIDVPVQEPGLAPLVHRAARHPELPGDLVVAQQSAIAQPLVA